VKKRDPRGFRDEAAGVGGMLGDPMSRRLFLPLATGAADERPTVDRVRKKLGGRASTEPGAGEIVVLSTERGERAGVVLFVRGEELDVWMEGDLVRRVRRGSTRAAGDQVSKDLLAVARDARAFASLAEGQRVGYQIEGGLGEGALVEKCRFGALVERADGTVLGVGFRRLFGRPSAPDHDGAASGPKPRAGRAGPDPAAS
jgi:hypothetical protein